MKENPEMNEPKKYNNTQVTLHWISAVLVLFMLFMGTFILKETPNSDPMKLIALKGHMIFGGIILLLTILRITWRRASTQPAHTETGNPFMDKLGIVAHYALNILTLLVALSGIGIAVKAGLPDIVFNGQGVLPESFNEFLPRIAHGILVKLLATLIALHVIAGLYHQFVLKDGLFSRMSFKKTIDS